MPVPLYATSYGPLPASTSHTILVYGPSSCANCHPSTPRRVWIEVIDAATDLEIIPATVDFSEPGEITVTFFEARSIYGRTY